jgi:dienelactone hydrolase
MADIHAEVVNYKNGTENLQGYLAYDAAISGRRPGILVIHEWWGIDDHIRGRVERLAKLGYCALAIDMYGEGRTADNPGDAGALMTAVMQNIKSGEARLAAGYRRLVNTATTDQNRIAAIGYCFGGAMVLHAARIGMDLRGVVSFHGALASHHHPAPGSVKAKVLVCHGAADNFIPEQDVIDFKQEMDGAGVDHRFKTYADAKHAFTNPAADENGRKFGINVAYNELADEQSWKDMQAFFSEIF